MEQQIEQLLKEVKGNETLERLVKMNKNPNALFIERIRTMNKSGNENENDKDSINLKAINNRLAKIYEKMKKSTQKNMDEDDDEDEIITRSNNPEGYNVNVSEQYNPNYESDYDYIDLEEVKKDKDATIWGPTESDLEEPESQDGATQDPTESDIKYKKVNWLNNPQGLSLIDFHRLLTENLFDDDSSDDEDIDYSTLKVIDNRKRNKK